MRAALIARLALLLAGSLEAAAADGPGFTSPDGTISIQSRSQTTPDGAYHVDFWAVGQDGHHECQLNRGETGDSSAYDAGFRFSPNSQWLVRMQKTAAGESTLFLYHRDGWRFISATGRQLGELAWDFLFTRPDAPHDVGLEDLSRETGLVAGLENNYAQLGEHWPDSRYLVIDLVSGESGTYPFGPWRCVYDTQTGQFSVPPDCAEFNRASAIKQKSGQEAWVAKRHAS